MKGLTIFLLSVPLRAAYEEPLGSPTGLVAADHELASRAGAEVLRQGGNAVDAAVATALALGVVQPAGSGLGGGGFLVVRRKDGTVRVLDFREVAPKAAHKDLFLDPTTGKVLTERSKVGGLAVGVPGEPAGLGEALRQLGTLPPQKVIAPALRLARDGFPVGRHLARTAAWVCRKLPAGEALAGLLCPDGKPLQIGQRLRRPELAHTLDRLAREGFESFYRVGPGTLGQQVVDAVRARGGVLAEKDLSGYRPVWREPLVGRYRGWQVFTNPPPGGGLTVLETLHILDARPPLSSGPLSSATLHGLAEAFKHAFADRARLLGDPAFVRVPTEELASAEYARRLAARLRDDGVLKPDEYGRGPGPAQPPRDRGTSHLCAVDRDGSAAALTTTVNLSFGAKVVAGTTGVLLNNQMDDFSARPGVANAFGLIGSEANAVAAGKRPLSSMSPLIAVRPDGGLICVGGSGGPTIVTGVVQALVNVIDFGRNAREAVSMPRIHAQFVPDKVFVERDVPDDVRQALARRGHKVVVSSGHGEGAVQMVVRLPPQKPGADAEAEEAEEAEGERGSVLTGASDPRKGGAPAAP